MSLIGLRHGVKWSPLAICVLTLALVAANVMVVPQQRVQAQDTGVFVTVSADNVNLRAGPGLDANEVGAAKKGDVFPVLGRARGSNRIWYKILLPSGATAWISERVVNVNPAPDAVPWLSDNPTKAPLVMDCGNFPPLLIIDSSAEVTRASGIPLYKEAGLGKEAVGLVKVKETVKVLDGPFCTREAKDYYMIQWLVETSAGVQGYMAEGLPDGKGGYIPFASLKTSTVSLAKRNPQPGDRPEVLANDDVQAVVTIFREVEHKKATRNQTEQKLAKFVEDRGKDSLAWIVRHTIIYDGKTGHWQNFARYEDLSLMEFSLSSPLDNDPVSTVLDILFGNYSSIDQVWHSMGCGGG